MFVVVGSLRGFVGYVSGYLCEDNCGVNVNDGAVVAISFMLGLRVCLPRVIATFVGHLGRGLLGHRHAISGEFRHLSDDVGEAITEDNNLGPLADCVRTGTNRELRASAKNRLWVFRLSAVRNHTIFTDGRRSVIIISVFLAIDRFRRFFVGLV